MNTDERGRFRLELPSNGSWSVYASARGYRNQFLDQHEEFSSAIVLTEKVPTLDVVFRITPDSAITGLVLDEGNEPVRQAQVAVHAMEKGSDGKLRTRGTRSAAITDDRGRYEVGGLPPGNYRISVQARPWYAEPARGFINGQQNGRQLDPSLDVVYPPTWYPGVTDEVSAGILKVQPGETLEADVQLLPVPSIHLSLTAPPPVESEADGARRMVQRFPQVQRISNEGNFGATSVTPGGLNGQIDVGGLTPGTYRIQTPDENGQPGPATIIEVTANSSGTVDLAAASKTATVTLTIEGVPDPDSLPIVFTNVQDEQRVFRSSPIQKGGFRGGKLPANAVSKPAPRTIEMLPGQYSVFQQGSNNYYLTGLKQGEKNIAGRMVTIPEGQSNLMIRLATGRATVTGIVNLNEKPLVGAMVVLVPTTVDDPGGIPAVRRDQTNTDGSFDLPAVIPGQYILIAIDRGWDLDWTNPSVIGGYLTKGIPLDLRIPANVRQDVEAQLP